MPRTTLPASAGGHASGHGEMSSNQTQKTEPDRQARKPGLLHFGVLRRFRNDERGQALTEFALVLPLLLLVLLGVIDFGKAINYWIDQTHLANEGARLAAVNNNAGGNLQQYLLGQTETAEQRGCQGTGSQGTQRSAHCATVNVCFYKQSDGSLESTGAAGDTVVVLVQYDYQWLRGFPFTGSPSTTVTGKAAMRLEATPTAILSSNNTGGACPSSA